jgi:hypothetical protein
MLRLYKSKKVITDKGRRQEAGGRRQEAEGKKFIILLPITCSN